MPAVRHDVWGPLTQDADAPSSPFLSPTPSRGVGTAQGGVRGPFSALLQWLNCPSIIAIVMCNCTFSIGHIPVHGLCHFLLVTFCLSPVGRELLKAGTRAVLFISVSQCSVGTWCPGSLICGRMDSFCTHTGQ